MSNFWHIANSHPYNKLRYKPWLLSYVFLRIFPESMYPSMSIEHLMHRKHQLSGRLEFLTRYFVSRIGFEGLWAARSRTTQAEVVSFYQEHDADVWRQAYLSIGDYEYKKKILGVYHLVSSFDIPKDAPLLDYGGGAGVNAHYLAMKGYKHVDLADIPSQTLDFVRSQMSDVLRKVITIDGTEQLPTNEYGAIMALDCLEHTLDPLNITKRLLTALKPGGIFIVNFPVETDFSHAHTREAQLERPAVFEYLTETCDALVPYLAYRKR